MKIISSLLLTISCSGLARNLLIKSVKQQQLFSFQAPSEMSLLSSVSSKINPVIFEYKKPNTYLSLMERVGDHGKYQQQMLNVFMLNWFVTGTILLSNIFLFRNRLYDCKAKGILMDKPECLKYICSLPAEQWDNFTSLDHNDFKNIATLNNYECEDSLPGLLASSCTYIGATLGFLFISFLSDNYGRKHSLLISWGICTLGSFIVVFNHNIILVSIGLFFSGFGCNAASNITFLFFCETLNNQKRQKNSIIVQVFFTIGALVGTTMFYFINDWRIVWSILVVFPAVIEFFLMLCYLEDTPRFLLRRGIKYALKAINRIGMVNLERRETLEYEDIANVVEVQMIQESKDIIITHLDLCKFDSLRLKTILCSLIAFAVYGMYFGPSLIAHNTALNTYQTTYIVLGSQLIISLPTYIFIEKIQRRQFGIIFLGVAVFCSLLFDFIEDPKVCGMCLDTNTSITLIIIFRAAVSFFFSFFLIYISEIFPSRVRGLSYGIVSSIGSLSSTFTPIVLTFFIQNAVNPMIIFAVTGTLAIGCLTMLPQTKGNPLRQQINQIRRYKKNKKQQKQFQDSRKKWRSEGDNSSNKSSKMIQSNKK